MLPGFENTLVLWLNIASAVVILFALFLILRRLVLWYFRLSRIAEDVRYIANYMRRQDGIPPKTD